MPHRSPGFTSPAITPRRSIPPRLNPRSAAACARQSWYCRMPEMKDYRPSRDLLKGRVVLVTGASRGIGRGAALTFSAHGATGVLHGRDVAALEKGYDGSES